MERQNILNESRILAVLIILYTVGAAGHLIKDLNPYMILLTPYTLLLTGSLVFISAAGFNQGNKLPAWCGSVFVITFLLEAAGVASGMIFGEYYYSNVLGLKLWNVPVIIGFNWMLVLLGSISLSLRFFSRPFYTGLSTAFLAVIFDYLLEPAAVRLNYWQWLSGSVPLQNYAAWGIFAFTAAFSFSILNIDRPKGRLAESYFIIQFVFFLILNIMFIN